MAAKKISEIRREDHAGHLDPAYAASLRARAAEMHPRENERAFIDPGKATDDLAEELAEEAVIAMTSGEDNLADDLDARVSEDEGGPFVPSTGREEFGRGTDASNPRGAKREPFPKT